MFDSLRFYDIIVLVTENKMDNEVKKKKISAGIQRLWKNKNHGENIVEL